MSPLEKKERKPPSPHPTSSGSKVLPAASERSEDEWEKPIQVREVTVAWRLEHTLLGYPGGLRGGKEHFLAFTLIK